MKKVMLIALGLTLGLIGQVFALDEAAKVTGASNYKKVELTSTQTQIFDGDGILEGIFISSTILTTPASYITFIDSSSVSDSASFGTAFMLYITTTVVSGGGVASYTYDSDGGLYSYMWKPPTPMRMNFGLAVTHSAAALGKSFILFKRLSD